MGKAGSISLRLSEGRLGGFHNFLSSLTITKSDTFKPSCSMVASPRLLKSAPLELGADSEDDEMPILVVASRPFLIRNRTRAGMSVQ